MQKLEIDLNRKLITEAVFVCENCGMTTTITYPNCRGISPILVELIARKIIDIPKEFRFKEPVNCMCGKPKHRLYKKTIDWAYPEYH